MNANNAAPEVLEEDLPPPPIDTLRGMVLEPAVRNYLIAGAAALAMIFLLMLARGSDIGGLLLALLGAAGMLFRLPAVPSFFLLLLLYFLVFPFGDPTSAFPDRGELMHGHLRVADVLLAFSIVVYLAAHYRVYAMAAEALPRERGSRHRKHVRRPPDLARVGEIPRLLYLAAGVVAAGQLAWLFTTGLEIDVNDAFPFHFAEDTPSRYRRTSGELYLWQTRLLVLFGLGFFGILLARLAFGYWRLRRQSAAEGALALQEASWSETHRERVRIENWRLWQTARTALARRKAADKEKS